MSGKSSRRKGHDWEREVAARMREVFGKDKVRRGLQARSGEEVPDVEVPCFWVECKHKKRTDLKAALMQAAAATPKGRIALAICKDDRRVPVVALFFEDFLELVREWWELSNR